MNSSILQRLIAVSLTLVLAIPASAIDKYGGGPIVAELVGRLLEQTHYARRPIDDAVSKEFLRNYLESYDYNHMILEKSDVVEFEAKYATTLDDRIKDGDVEAAYEIYDRVKKRLEERVELVKSLTSSTFTFTNDDKIILDRHELDWPETPAAAKELWRLRIKHEVLLEELAKIKTAEAKAAAAKKAAEKEKKDKEEVAAKEEPKKDEKPAKVLTIKETIDQRYDRILRSYAEYDGIDVFSTFVSALTRVYDPHTDYLAAAQKENFDISMKLSLVGIGAVLRSEDGYARIVSLVPGGPADSDKRLKPNDKIEAVAQGDGPFIEVVGMKLDRLVQMIRGEKGSTVRMRVIPNDAIDPSTRVVITIVRDEIKLTDQEAKAKIYTVPGKSGKPSHVGVLDLPSFYADMRGGSDGKSATRDVERLIAEMKRRGVDSLIVDLRRDGGGSLSEAVSLTGLFINTGPVVQVKDARGTIKLLRDNDSMTAFDGPMIVLTSRGSASASEIFAAAMQDYGRGAVVGEKSTFGKGTVQSVLELNQYLPPAYRSYKPGALKLTIQKFYRVSGGSTQHRGVLPDIHIPFYGDNSESTESAQKGALPYDEVEPAPYDRSAILQAHLSNLAKASKSRIESSKEFRWIEEDMTRWEKQKKDKALSLNIKTRLAERKIDEDRQTTRKKERAARKEKPFASEEITLEILDGKTPAVSTTTASATPAAPLDEDDPGYDRSPDAPDAVLNETLRIASDLTAITPPLPIGQALRNQSGSITQ
ncbi:MAG: tail-specific protease [Elusimicrobia bacterium CG11_big_fil_rev_8_21_14_0_20_64_6]|nr:MAG: tail-specific protease [Elusimicrobia bacterium CG11_big_fil_rev_8_21_14_0_20_64_6]